MSSASCPNATIPEGWDPSVAYKCRFCDVTFLNLQSILNHNANYCHRRHELPRSCTVTTAMLANDEPPSDGKAASCGQSQESDEVPEPNPVPNRDKAPPKIKLAIQIRHGHSYERIVGTDDGKLSKPGAKRKRSLDEGQKSLRKQSNIHTDTDNLPEFRMNVQTS